MEIQYFAPYPELTGKGIFIAAFSSLAGAFAACHVLMDRGHGVMLFFGKRVNSGDKYFLQILALMVNSFYGLLVGFGIAGATDCRQYAIVSIYTTLLFAGYILFSRDGSPGRSRNTEHEPP